MFVEETESSLHADVRGTTYYFCSETCMQSFVSPELELRSLKRMVALSAILSVPILFLSYAALPKTFPTSWILLALATPVQFVAGWKFYRGFWDAVKMRASNMDVLIAIGTSAAYVYSTIYTIFPEQFPYGGLYFDASAVVIALLLTGKLLEYMVRGKATDAISKLMSLQPRTATVIRADGTEEEVPIEQVQADDVFAVKPGEKVATDGVVVEGNSTVDEKLLTGESMPVEKSPGSEVIGATINQRGFLKVRATRVGMDTTLSKIVKVVQDAQSTKSPIERLANTITTYFVPIVVLVALTSFSAWLLLGGKPVSFAFTAAVAVLVIACPCALGLATPAAIVVGAGKGAENGILIKGGEYLERTQKIDTVVFDKTGTLTKGEPSVTDVLSFDSDEDKILKLAAIAEKQSEHPLALAIVGEAKKRFQSVPDPESFEAITGQGVRCGYSGKEILLGNQKLINSSGITVSNDQQSKINELRSRGKTVMIVAVDRAVVGAIGMADTLKESSKEAIHALQKMGLEVIMLTGDNKETAAAIAKELGINRYIAEVSPVDKSDAIKKLQAEKKHVAMVGDGVNDAPALAQADVGIALGSGSDIAIETGGLILMRDDPRDVVAGIQLSRKTMSKIKQNLFWAFMYNVALIPVAAGALYLLIGVLLSPIVAGGAMAMSSVTVVTNSLTLRRFKPKF